MRKKSCFRLAPSPTGAQHLGNARTYLINWLMARSQGGTLRLRMEDLDSPRIKAGAAPQAVDDLRWLGLDWDGEIVTQSNRLDLYRNALELLKKRDRIYPCTCTRSDVLAAASAPHAGDEGPCYPRTCAHRHADDLPKGQPFCWRYRVEESPMFVDRFRGETHVDITRQLGDFVIWKSDDTPAYQLAVVVDDAAMEIDVVVRGDDLVPSTPRQLLLFREWGWSPPEYAHVPLVIGPDGKRLAKRHGDTRLQTFKAQGVQPEQIIGMLAWSCGWIENAMPIAAKELIPLFDLKAIPKEPFRWNGEL